MGSEDVPLFDVQDSPVPRPLRKPPASKAKPRWTRYHSATGIKCDECMSLLAERQGDAPASRQARYRRSVGPTYLLLCYAHAEQWREDDGLANLA